MIRAAEPKDLDALLSLGKRFTRESSLPFTWDPERARQTVWAMLHDEQSIMLVYEEDGVIAGLVMGAVERDFFVQSSAYITKFYVERELRGVGVSEALVRAFESAASERGANVIFSAATAGMGETVEKLYVRLFKASGFTVLGRVLVKEL